jgi:2-Cys peroxiredoxin 5
VIIYCVNDGAVMTGWKDTFDGANGSMLNFLADPRSELTKALGLVMNQPGPMGVLGNPRCQRFSMLIDDGIIKTINLTATADDPAGDDNPTNSLVEQMLEDLKK